MVAPTEKASLLGSQFDSKQRREQFVTRLSCFLRSRCNSLTFRISVLLCLLLNLDTYGSADHFCVFPLFAPILSKIFCRLIRLGLFPECRWFANVTAIPKSAPSSDRKNYRLISITPILTKVNWTLVSHKLSSSCEKCDLLPAAKFDYRKGLGCTDALLTISLHF